MPFNSEQLAYAAKHSLDYFLRNDPIDNVNVDRPLIKRLMAEQVAWAGGLQNVVEQLRFTNDSNFMSFFGDQQVSYNRKRTLDQAKFPWGSFHDGFGLNEDEFAQNGVIVTDDKDASADENEEIQLSNLFKENMETLKAGFTENFDLMLHRNGSASATDIPGLDALISTTPTAAGTVGGLDQVAKPWWQNTADTAIATGTLGVLTTHMQQAWRKCFRVGGSTPNMILAGSAFIDAYTTDADAKVNRQVIIGSSGGNKNATTLDASVGEGSDTGLYFKGVPVQWDPVFENLDALDAPAIPWTKRCYFINTKFLKLRPIKGHWMISRKPPRVYDRYTHYTGLTSKAALTTDKRVAHAVLSIA